MTQPNEATLAQHIAAQPRQSTWLSANAGSGKTRVLTDRTARLLLDGVPPERILCLTYTKAAASEMQNRLFDRLGTWAMLDDGPLRDELASIGVEDIGDLDHARTLFARAIETPGGLKIQTIHSFCAAILRRFPVEAGLPPGFTEIDEVTAARLVTEVLSRLADGDGRSALEAAGRYVSDDSFAELAFEVLGRQEAFDPPLDAAAIWDLFDLPKGFSATDLEPALFNGDEDAMLGALVRHCATGSSTDQKAAARLAPLTERPLTLEDLPDLASVFLYASGNSAGAAKIGAFPTKATRAAMGAEIAPLEAFMARVETAAARQAALAAADRTLALHEFARAFLPAYRAEKMRHGWLDFDDLIRRTRSLLQNSASAAWVLYKLDGGIDHILVDEAQDTSPAQWDVIAKLSEEMLAGAGKDDRRRRTIFVVGDKKQSIYSFQGADPRSFDAMADHFTERLEHIGALDRRELAYSFRSAAAILHAVDETYYTPGPSEDVSRHRAFFDAMPGRVDLWPVVEPEGSEEPENWWDPVDLPGEHHHSVVLAHRIAEFVTQTIATETLGDGAARRPVRAGDVLILVQGRSALFHNIIRALKTKGLPVAGADRLQLTAELAVRDLISLLRFLALPEDDLALAEALRSPLFGWDEAALFGLGHGRKGYLWTALRDASDTHPETVARLRELRDRADFLRPYELLEHILTNQDGRARLIARLGREAEDGIDLLLTRALHYETVDIPSLTGFLVWLESGDVTVKRQAGQAGEQIRVMTVHGAKGLEAPIVILPDTLRRPAVLRDDVLVTPDGQAVWKKGPKGNEPPPIAAARLAAEARDEEERRRLLYVAMTRAEKWLIVCGSGAKAPANSWHAQVRESLERLKAYPHETPTGPGLRLSTGDWTTGPVAARPAETAERPQFPRWIDQQVDPTDRPDPPLSPSDLGGAKTLAGEEGRGEEGRAYGTALHRLLEHLPAFPEADWDALAAGLVDPAHREAALADARALIQRPDLAEIFGADALAEVPVAAALPDLGGREIRGAIDRLVVGETRVLAVDFKSNAVVPDRPEDVPVGLLRQMGAYAAALDQVYPGRRIETAILWTRTGRLMTLPRKDVIAALSATPPP